MNMEELAHSAAMSINSGEIIGWFQGAMEFGPRALGNRSILADPRRSDMKDRINRCIKKRESFRPFAPAVKLDKASVYFDIDNDIELPHMLFTVNVQKKYRTLLPSITHADGSARIQTVSQKDHPAFWSLIDEFEKISGMPIILNTSFNVQSQPIVCNPFDAVSTLLDSGLNKLYINQFLVEKK